MCGTFVSIAQKKSETKHKICSNTLLQRHIFCYDPMKQNAKFVPTIKKVIDTSERQWYTCATWK